MKKKYICANKNNLKEINIRNLRVLNMVYSCKKQKVYDLNSSSND